MGIAIVVIMGVVLLLMVIGVMPINIERRPLGFSALPFMVTIWAITACILLFRAFASAAI
jgi:hypothetical protein